MQNASFMQQQQQTKPFYNKSCNISRLVATTPNYVSEKLSTYKFIPKLPRNIQVHSLVPATTSAENTDALEPHVESLHYQNASSTTPPSRLVNSALSLNQFLVNSALSLSQPMPRQLRSLSPSQPMPRQLRSLSLSLNWFLVNSAFSVKQIPWQLRARSLCVSLSRLLTNNLVNSVSLQALNWFLVNSAISLNQFLGKFALSWGPRALSFSLSLFHQRNSQATLENLSFQW